MSNPQNITQAPQSSESFRVARGLDYRQFLEQLHQNTIFDWYLEVGTDLGRSLVLSRSKSISVDPSFRLNAEPMGKKPALHLFQMGSDDFFESGFLERNGIKLSFSFLDGMHHFEFLLRDFMNTEAASDPRGVIALHDCCPRNSEMEQRENTNKAWTGDVWKLIPILRKYRPDLTMTVLDCASTGLVLLSGLDPENMVLRQNYDNILADFMGVRLLDYGLSQFNNQFDYSSAEEMAKGGFQMFSGVALSAAQQRK